jgi:hypothetical protein
MEESDESFGDFDERDQGSEDDEDSDEDSDDERSDKSEKRKESEKKVGRLVFAQSENEKFRSASRTKTPFFVMSEQDETKEGLELIKEISSELDEIFQNIPGGGGMCKEYREGLWNRDIGKKEGMEKGILIKPTRRDVEKDSERWVSYKSSVPNDFSSNKTFSFS